MVQLRVTNFENSPYILQKGVEVGIFHLYDNEPLIQFMNDTRLENDEIIYNQPPKDIIPPAKARELIELFQLDKRELEPAQLDSALQILYKYDHIISKHEFDIGETQLIQQHIDTGTNQPVCQAPYQVDPIKREEIQRQVKEMLKHDIIEPSNSMWASPVLLVKKA